jgi:hypothetical protein
VASAHERPPNTYVLLNDLKLNGYPGCGKLFQSPEGTAENSPGRQSWVNMHELRSPVGTAEHRSTGFQSSLTGLDPLHPVYPGLPSWAILSRPFGTLEKFSAACI